MLAGIGFAMGAFGPGCSSTPKDSGSGRLSVAERAYPVGEFYKEASTPAHQARHVHLMHLSGVRGDLVEALLEAGQLPHFSLLLARGRLSTQATANDRPEAPRALESILTSRRDAAVAGDAEF